MASPLSGFERRSARTKFESGAVVLGQIFGFSLHKDGKSAFHTRRNRSHPEKSNRETPNMRPADCNSWHFRIRREINKWRNIAFLQSRKIADWQHVMVEDFPTRSPNKAFARHFMPFWLHDIDVMIEKAGLDPQSFHFLDAGCGKGIVTLFVRDQFPFASVTGFDFVPDFIEVAGRNHKNSTISGPIDFYVGDAAEWRLDDKRWFIFLYNPFGKEILEQFLINNYAMLNKHQSVIAYGNCIEMETVLRFPHRRSIPMPHIRSAVILF
jgi:SAM-dependent methyltransferase